MFKTVLSCAALLLLGACASYKPTTYEKSGSNVVEVALIDDIMSKKPVAYGGQGASSAFGAIGAMAALQIAADRSDKLRASLDTISYDPEERLRERLAAALTNAGYNVTLVNVGERPKPAYLKKYEGAPENADAYLDVYLTWGFNAAQTKLWVPTVGADIQLAGKDGKKILAKDAIILNPALKLKGLTVIPVAEEEGAESFEKLAENPQAMADWLDKAFDRVIDEIIAKLD